MFVFCSKAIQVCTDPIMGDAVIDLKKRSTLLKTFDGSSDFQFQFVMN